MRQLSTFCVGLAVCAALGGCGDASQPEAKARHPVEHGVFISARDCAATGKLTVDQCGQAIDAAVARHEAEAPSYGSLSQCEATVGADRCDKGVDGRYRLRLQAFFVTMAIPAHAVPLYPPSDVHDRLPVAVQTGDRRTRRYVTRFQTRHCLWLMRMPSWQTAPSKLPPNLDVRAADIH